MNNKQTTPAPFDLDSALNELEDDALMASLSRMGDEGALPPQAAQRLQGRMHSMISAPQARQKRAGLAGWLQKWTAMPKMPRLAATLSMVLVIAIVALAFSASIKPNVASAAELLDKAQKRTEQVVEAGQVRHIVREVSSQGSQGLQQFITEIWITQGDGHLLTSWRIQTRNSESEPYMESLKQVIGQTTTSNYDPYTNTVYQGPFDPCALDLAQWIGSKSNFEQMKNDPTAKVVGTETINGINTVIVEAWGQRTWIAPDSGLFVQSETIDNSSNFTSKDKLTVDEILSPVAVPQDLFTFTMPKGAKLITLDKLCSNG